MTDEREQEHTENELETVQKTLVIKSSAFGDGDMIPVKYTCEGEDVSPPLSIEGVSEEALSLVLIVEDPDVPLSLRNDGLWHHWILFNIPPTTKKINEGETPDAIAGKGTHDSLNYHGPCPPDGEHRYFFKLFSLDILLDVPEGASIEEVEEAMTGHVLQKAELMGLYEKSS